MGSWDIFWGKYGFPTALILGQSLSEPMPVSTANAIGNASGVLNKSFRYKNAKVFNTPDSCSNHSFRARRV